VKGEPSSASNFWSGQNVHAIASRNIDGPVFNKAKAFPKKSYPFNKPQGKKVVGGKRKNRSWGAHSLRIRREDTGSGPCGISINFVRGG